MRYKQSYTLFRRKDSQNKIYYFQYYHPISGKRSVARSTGITQKTAARTYIEKFLKQLEDSLLTNPDKDYALMTLKEYSSNWYDFDVCPYIQKTIKRGGTYTKGFAKNRRAYLENHVWPELGNTLMNSFTVRQIEEWQYQKLEKSSIQSVQHYTNTLKLILDEAKRLGDISFNPFEFILPLIVTNKHKEILETSEVKNLFAKDALSNVWEGKKLHFLLNYTAYKTGLRLGELLALRKSDLSEEGILVKHSYDKNFGLKTTKSGKTRFVRYESNLYALLLRHCLEFKIGDGYIFSVNEGETPIWQTGVRKYFNRALNHIKIDDEKRKERNITFHSWRHLYNDTLVKSHINETEIQKQTGHQSGKMTKHYSHPESKNKVAGLDKALTENFICIEAIG